jgi:hypothetical protein
METEEQINNLYNNVTDKIKIIHERTMNVRHLVSWGYEDEFNNQLHRHKMGGDRGIHLTPTNTEEDGA